MTSKSPVQRVLDAATEIAANAPKRRGTYVTHAKIYWPLIEELRSALAALDAEVDLLVTKREQ